MSRALRLRPTEPIGSNLVWDRKKPMVLASNRGHYSSKNLRVVEWWVGRDSNP